ncbi:MAG: YqgE/AlgH family protein [Acidobacteriota bacterium]
MSENRLELNVPVLLIAMPQVQDPDFERTVILLTVHTEAGSEGLVLNREAPLEIREVLAGLDLHWSGMPDQLAHFGGPVERQIGTVLYGAGPVGPPEASHELLEGLSLTQQVAVLSELSRTPPDRMCLYLGYAGWGEGQLLEEILRNDWLIAPVVPEFVFSPTPSRMWEDALASVGVDPNSLPSWSPVGQGSAN